MAYEWWFSGGVGLSELLCLVQYVVWQIARVSFITERYSHGFSLLPLTQTCAHGCVASYIMFPIVQLLWVARRPLSSFSLAGLTTYHQLVRFSMWIGMCTRGASFATWRRILFGFGCVGCADSIYAQRRQQSEVSVASIGHSISVSLRSRRLALCCRTISSSC